MLSPLTKLDIIDVAPLVASQFYFDGDIKAYLLVLLKSKWDQLSGEVKHKFMVISRRIKEEMEGPMSTLARERYESTDIFELVMAERKVLPETEASQSIDLNNIEGELDAELAAEVNALDIDA